MQETRNDCFKLKKRNTTLREAKTRKHECRNIAATYDTAIRQAKTGKHESTHTYIAVKSARA